MAAATVLALLWGTALTVAAQSPGESSAAPAFMVTTWSEQDGLPSSRVWSLAQDQRGYLWLGTATGLVRFDGVHFVRLDELSGLSLPEDEVYALYAASDGRLWAGFGGGGGIVRVEGTDVTVYREGGISTDFALSLAEDRSGRMWAGGFTGLYNFQADHWERWGADGGIPDGQAFVATDESGALVVTVSGIAYHLSGPERFEPLPTAVDRLRAEADASLLRDRPVLARVLSNPSSSSPLRDRHGGIWIRTFADGVWYVSPRPAEEGSSVHFLAGASVRSALIDREDNVWVGTPTGLHRLSRRKVTAFTGLGVVHAVAAAPDGTVWVGTDTEVFPVTVSGGGSIDGPFSKAPSGRVLALHVDRQGMPWVGTRDGLFRVIHGTLVRVPGSARMVRISVISSDAEGTIWVSDLSQGIYQLKEGTLQLVPIDTKKSFEPAYAMHADARGRLWIGFAGGRVGVRHPNGAFEVFQGDDPQSQFRFAHQDRTGRIWLVSNTGLTRFADGSLVTVGPPNGLPWGRLSGVVEDDEGYLWVGVNAGVVRLHPREVDRIARDPEHQVLYRFYDLSDGLAGTPIWLANPSAARGLDGRLWFVTGRGLTSLDPVVLRERPPAPPVMIETATVDDRALDPTPDLVFPPHLARLEIDYTGLSLTSGTKLRFRYWLDGFDGEWVDAGSRRRAVYTNLGPGDYRFRVTAHDGYQWTEDVTWAFSISPIFYETSWFYLVCVLVAGVAVGGVWYARMRAMRLRFAAILGERTRMSRAIHDTLLQDLIGTSLRIGVLSTDDRASTTDLRGRLTRLRKEVERQIREVRQSVWDLRSPSLQSSDLASALHEAGAEATVDTPVAFELEVLGSPRRVAPDVEEQLLRVGREAIANAVRHARAAGIRVALEYDDRSLRLRVTDDGCGFDEGACAVGWGLRCMRERISELGGRLHVSTAPSRGTTIEAVIPIGRAGSIGGASRYEWRRRLAAWRHKLTYRGAARS